jgi:hypothetical protein
MRGVILVFVVVAMIFVSFAVALYVSTMVLQESRLTATYIDGVIALNLAEAGVDQALYTLKKEKAGQPGVRAPRSQLADALEAGREVTIRFVEPAFYQDLSRLVPAGHGSGTVRVEAEFVPDSNPAITAIDPSKIRLGLLTIHSQGIYTNPQKGVVKRQIRVVTRVLGTNLLVVAPEYGFFSRDPRNQVYHVPSLALDARDFDVRGGNVYIENGMGIELTEHLMSKEFRPLREVGFLDLGYDTFNFFTLFNGGVNFTHSKEIEFLRNGIQRRYFQFQGLAAVFGPGPAWLPVDQPYRNLNIVRQVAAPPSDSRINLYRAEDYRKIASVVVDPQSPRNPNGNPDDRRWFTDVFFPGPLDMRNTVYRNVLPLYGWGDWRRVPPWVSANPTRRDDVGNAVNFDGVTFVRGDVFLEGWYHGVGTLVVQGNVYVGGKVMGLPPQITGGPSLLNIVALEDPEREVAIRDIYNKVTGRVIYKPHHDQDFDRMHLNLLRELRPYFDGAIYAKNGVETDRTSFLDQLFNLEVEFNLVTDLFDWQRLPNDVFINGTDPYDIVFGRDTGRERRKGFNPSFSTDIVSWQQEETSL